MDEESKGRIYLALGLIVFIVVVVVIALAKPTVVTYAIYEKTMQEKTPVESYKEIVGTEAYKKVDEIKDKVNDSVMYKDIKKILS